MSVELREPVDRSGIYSWFGDRIKGHVFRLKNGRVLWRAEKLSIDSSYERHYGFLNVAVRLRHTESGRTQWVTESELRCDFVEVTA